MEMEKQAQYERNNNVLEKGRELLDKTIYSILKLSSQKKYDYATVEIVRTDVNAVETSIQDSNQNNIEKNPFQNLETSFSNDFELSVNSRNKLIGWKEERMDDKYGSLTVALLSLATRTAGLILCIVYLTMPKPFTEEKLKYEQRKMIKYFVIICTGECSIVIVVSILLFLGLLLQKRRLLLPWLFWTFLESFCCLVAIIPLIVFVILGLPWYPIFIWICFLAPLISLHRSCASFVSSHYSYLSEKAEKVNNEKQMETSLLINS